MEPDLDKKYNIIAEAAGKYPLEANFKTSLKLIKERRDLINSIVVRARQQEERGQLNDAAGQWDIIKNIHPLYPGLDFELQRLARRREEQARNETKALWVEKFDRHLNVGEHEKAREVAGEALAEFPGDEELLGLAALAEQSIKRSADAERLVLEGQDLLARKDHEAGLGALREAARLDERNPSIRGALIAAVLKQAREFMLQDWRRAEPLVTEAVALDGTDPVVRSLVALVEDYKRQEAVRTFVMEARSLQGAGDLEGALKKVEEGLAIYPNELRLSQLHNALRTAKADRPRETSLIRPAAKMPAPAESTAPAPPAVEKVFGAAAGGRDRRIEKPVRNDLPAARPGPSQPLSLSVDRDMPESSKVSASVRHKLPLKSHWIWLGTAGAAVLVLLAAILSGHKTQPAGAVPGVNPIDVTFHANVANARITLDGKLVNGKTSVAPGRSYRAQATADGYGIDAQNFMVPANSTGPISIAFHLQPSLPRIENYVGFESRLLCTGWGESQSDLQDGGVLRESIPAGEHSLQISDGKREVFAFGFRVKPTEMVTIPSQIAGKGSPGVVVTSLNAAVKIYGSQGIKAGVEGQPLASLPAEGLPMSLRKKESARLLIDDGRGKTQAVDVEYSPVPILNVFLSGAPETHSRCSDGKRGRRSRGNQRTGSKEKSFGGHANFDAAAGKLLH